MKTGVSSLQDGQVIEGKDLRPCHTEYPLTSASARPNRRAIRLGQATAGDSGRCRPARLDPRCQLRPRTVTAGHGGNTTQNVSTIA